MTYPQPSSTQPVINGQEFFRLKTALVSPGDIYESEVSALGIVLGPDSDIANITTTYFDPQAATFTAQATISPDRDLMGRVDARNDERYPGITPRKGRILYSVGDIFNSRWRPSAFDGSDRIEFETPIIDVIQYFSNAPSITPQRSDKTYHYEYLQAPGGVAPQKLWIVIPAYGRKSGMFTWTNLHASDTVTANVLGVRFSPSGTVVGGPTAFQLQLVTNAILFGGSATYKYKSATDGLWDLFAIGLTNYTGAAMPTTITLSDDVE